MYSYHQTNNPYSPYTPNGYGNLNSFGSGLPSSREDNHIGIINNGSSTASKRRKEEHVSYFVPGYGISRQVILSWYQRLLGPTATIRPFSYQQREGYMITNAGSPLTKVGLLQTSLSWLRRSTADGSQDQIEDLKRLSQEFEEREAMRMVAKAGTNSNGEVFINQPVPVQQRRHYVPEPSYYDSKYYGE